MNWYNKVTRCLVFPDGQGFHAPDIPDINTLYDNEAMETVWDLDDDLKPLSVGFLKAGIHLLKTVNGSGVVLKPSDFNEFENLLSEITFKLERLGGHIEKPQSKQSGTDAIIPNTHDAMMFDMDNEIQKVKRHGYQFSIVLLKLQNFDTVAYQPSEIFAVIQKCLRPYDNAYAIEDYKCVIYLKYTDTPGSLHAYERIKEVLQEHNMMGYDDDGNKARLRACIYVPEPFDTSEDVLNKLQEQLAAMKPDQDIVLNHEENSPVLKYLMDDGQS